MRTAMTSNASADSALALVVLADSTTRSTTRLPAGITTPLLPCTASPSAAVKRSPALWVVVQIRAAGFTAKCTPASTVPVGAAVATAGCGAACGGPCGAGCGIEGAAAATGAVPCGAGDVALGACSGARSGERAGALGAGVGAAAGTGATSLSCGCPCMAGASSIFRGFAVSASLPPQAAPATNRKTTARV